MPSNANMSQDAPPSCSPDRSSFFYRLFSNSRLGEVGKNEVSERPAERANPPSSKVLPRLSSIFEPSDDVLVDIIFVHGFLSGSSSAIDSFWPQSWLPDDPDFRHARVHAFVYDADWRGRGQSILSMIQDSGRALLSAMRDSPCLRSSRNNAIIVVGNGVGGLVAKAAYVLARRNSSYRALASRLRAFFFLATPHRGQNPAAVVRTLLDTAGVPDSDLDLGHDLDSNLSALTRELRDLNDLFLRHGRDLRLWSFFGSRPASEEPDAIDVDEACATLDCGENETVIPTDADHRCAYPFTSRGDPNFKTFRNALSRAVELVTSGGSDVPLPRLSHIPPYKLSASTIKDPWPPSAETTLKEYLGVDDSLEDHLLLLQETRLPGSCAWLAERAVCKTWIARSSESRPVLWLTGQPGAGKSIASSFVADLLSSEGHDCCYFFFHQGQTSRSSSSNAMFVPLLAHLAYQMALKDDAVREKILSLREKGVSWQRHDGRSLWRKVFLEGIFELEQPARPSFWVIDGLDERSGAAAFMEILTQLPESVRVFVASRTTPEIDRGLVFLESRVEVHAMSARDTVSDMGSVIQAGLEFLSLQGGDNLVSKILAQSAGSFMWVRLVLQELARASATSQDAEEIMDSIPDDLSGLYKRIGCSMESDESLAKIAKSVLFFVVLAVRPLTVEELCHAVRLDTQTDLTPDTMERILLETACGQLVMIDRGRRVHMAHGSARDFLLNGNRDCSLAISCDAGNGHFTRLCLSFIEEFFQRRKQSDAKNPGAPGERKYLDQDVAFLNYASTLFSQHLLRSKHGDNETFQALRRFIDHDARHWIRYIADEGDISTLTETSMDISQYAEQLTEAHSATDVEELRAWALDLSRTAFIFRGQLQSDPSAIHDLIPALYTKIRPGTELVTEPSPTALSFTGLHHSSGGDCVAKIQTRNATIVANGEALTACGERNGNIVIYDSVILRHVIDLWHPSGSLIQMRFGCGDRFLVSANAKEICLWDTESWALLHTLECFVPKAFLFTETTMLVGQSDGMLLSCNLSTLAVETTRWFPEQDPADETSRWSTRSIQHVLLSRAREGLVAVALWSKGVFIFEEHGTRVRGPFKSPRGVGINGMVRAMALHPSSLEHSALAVAFSNDFVALFNGQTAQREYMFPRLRAQAVAFSPDGGFLVVARKPEHQCAIEVFQIIRTHPRPLAVHHVHTIHYPSRDMSDFAMASGALRFATLHGRTVCRVWDISHSIAQLEMRNTVTTMTTMTTQMTQMTTTPTKNPPDQEGSATTSIIRASSPLSQKRGEISCMCLTADGKVAICGTDQGSVVCFDISSGAELGVLYQFQYTDLVTDIVLVETPDHVFMIMGYRQAFIIFPMCYTVIAEVRLTSPRGWAGASVVPIIDRHDLGQDAQILVSPNQDRVLIVTKSWITLLALPSAEVLKDDLVPEIHMAFYAARQDPSDEGVFMVYSESFVYLFNWADGKEVTGRQLGFARGDDAPVGDKTRLLMFNFQSYDGILVDVLICPEKIRRGGMKLVAARERGTCPARLSCWRISDSPSASPPPLPSPSDPEAAPALQPIPGLGHLSAVIEIVLCVIDSSLVFVDSDLWVCTADLNAFPATFTARRHFFLMPEWTTSDGWFRACVVPLTRALVFANRQGVVLVENWMASWQTVRLRPGWKAWEVLALREAAMMPADEKMAG